MPGFDEEQLTKERLDRAQPIQNQLAVATDDVAAEREHVWFGEEVEQRHQQPARLAPKREWGETLR